MPRKRTVRGRPSLVARGGQYPCGYLNPLRVGNDFDGSGAMGVRTRAQDNVARELCPQLSCLSISFSVQGSAVIRLRGVA